MIGPMTKRPKSMEINKVKNGVIIKSTTSGITFLRNNCNLEAKIPSINAGKTEP